VNTLEEWAAAVCRALGLEPDALSDRSAVLDLARDAAHGVARPAAPLTTFLLGVAVGRGQSLADTAAKLQALAAEWEAASANDGSTAGPGAGPGRGAAGTGEPAGS
jgi:Domain of unknown function (DUF6457)